MRLRVACSVLVAGFLFYGMWTASSVLVVSAYTAGFLRWFRRKHSEKIIIEKIIIESEKIIIESLESKKSVLCKPIRVLQLTAYTGVPVDHSENFQKCSVCLRLILFFAYIFWGREFAQTFATSTINTALLSHQWSKACSQSTMPGDRNCTLWQKKQTLC